MRATQLYEYGDAHLQSQLRGVTGNSINSMGYLVSTGSARAIEKDPAHQERKEKKGEIKMRGKQFAYNHQQLSDTV